MNVLVRNLVEKCSFLITNYRQIVLPFVVVIVTVYVLPRTDSHSRKAITGGSALSTVVGR